LKHIKKTMEKIDNRPADTEEVSTILEEFLAGGMTPEDTVIMVIDTTSHSTSFLLHLLAKNPDKQEKLREENLQVGPDLVGHKSQFRLSMNFIT
jgi:cytochrome P450